ncbi:NUDIX domain-containing protein [Bifidobacterium sp. SO1]|nr:NUDIX domain-containing protein [Bifidobacterium sp. SO1]MBT1162366.1 NUDIX domain-containing protein [Bifidobacterium sp. SO1]
MISDESIDNGVPFDWGRVSDDYARYRGIYPAQFYQKILGRGLISAGYPTPRLDTRAAIFDVDGRILLTYENSGEWSLPGGWVDENQSVRSNAIKEVKEETGLDVTADRLVAVQDCANHNGLSFPYGVIKFFVLCTRVGGCFESNIETTEIRYFDEDRLPRLSTTRNTAEQIAMCFAAHRDPDWTTLFE